MFKKQVTKNKNSEKEILKKFKDGGYIESDRERKVLEKWASAGLVRFGVDFKNMKAEAKLTKRGRWLLPGFQT